MEEKSGLHHELLQPENQHECVALARALCPFAEAATDATMLICVALVEAKGDEKAVAESLGFSISRLRSHCQSALAGKIMRALAKEKLLSTGYVKAMAALEDVAGSESQTGTSRRNAAQAIIELVKEEDQSTGNKAGGGIDLNNMTLAELEAYAESIKRDIVHYSTPRPMIE